MTYLGICNISVRIHFTRPCCWPTLLLPTAETKEVSCSPFNIKYNFQVVGNNPYRKEINRRIPYNALDTTASQGPNQYFTEDWELKTHLLLSWVRLSSTFKAHVIQLNTMNPIHSLSGLSFLSTITSLNGNILSHIRNILQQETQHYALVTVVS